MTPHFQDGNVALYLGDCLDVMRTMPDHSVDSIVTDPPYGLSFMGKKWDYDVPSQAIWEEALRVLKPGGHLLAFAGTRTQHRMAVRIEDAGFEIRDMIAWVYGSGFPKSLDVGKAIDKAQADDYCGGQACDAWRGWGTALKPSLEPITVARKPIIGTVAANVLAHGTGGLNIDGCRVGTDGERPAGSGNPCKSADPAAIQPGRGGGNGGNVTPLAGRWPANLIHDGSDEVVALFPVTGASKAGNRGLQHSGRHGGLSDIGGNIKEGTDGTRGHDDNGGSAARYFYCASHEKQDLLFCRAKAILYAWRLTKGDQPCSQENASVVESSLCLSKQAVVSVLSDAVIAASRGDKLLSDVRGLSTTATERECGTLCESLITAILISESDALPAPSQDATIPNGCLVSIAAIKKPTDTMTITISLPTSGGSAASVMFDIMPSSVVHGEADSASRFRYCAKASKKDRNEGCEGLEEKDVHRYGAGIGEGLDPNAPARNRNTHATVKPTDLMRYLCRLVTPPGGTVLDCFMGSGSTGKASVKEGYGFIGIDNDPESIAIAIARIKYAIRQKSECSSLFNLT